MYKNILVITDNVLLAGQLEQIILDNTKNENVNFAISPFTQIQPFKEKLSVAIGVVNLKDEKEVKELIDKYDLIFSIHCKQIFPDNLVNEVKCINIHPGYNPINRGWYPQVFAIINDLQIGATIHEIDTKLDNGPIIAQELVSKYEWDTSKTIYDRVLEKEIELFKNNVQNILKGAYTTKIPEGESNLFLKSDFNKLLHLDLEEVGTFHDFLKRLRALTHGEYKNAYFIDPDSGKKIYVSLNLELKSND